MVALKDDSCKRVLGSGSGSNNGVFCEDMLVEILCRLPPKPLIRFKCVSKGWYCLISHVCVPKISPLPVCGMYLLRKSIRNYCVGYMPMPMPMPNDEDQIRGALNPFNRRPDCLNFVPFRDDMVDCCNGMSLCYNQSVNRYYLWNFMSFQFAAIPPLIGDSDEPRDRVCAALAFNPRESAHYKVVQFVRSPSKLPQDGVRLLNIFSSETGKWVEYSVQHRPPVNKAPLIRRCIYSKGALYRLAKSGHLLRYDLEEVNVTAIELPEFSSWTDTGSIGCIGLSKGRLHYARHDAARVLIWMLREHCDASEWVLTHSISAKELTNHPLISPILRLFPPSSGFKPIAFDPTSNAIILWPPEIILCYHLNNKKLEVVRFVPSKIWRFNRVLQAFPFSPCLVPMKDIGQNHHPRQYNL